MNAQVMRAKRREKAEDYREWRGFGLGFIRQARRVGIEFDKAQEMMTRLPTLTEDEQAWAFQQLDFDLPCYIVLATYAIENLLKGLLVAQKVSVLDEKERLTKTFSTHNLTKLAQEANLYDSLTNEQKFLLLKLRSAAEGSCRYPIGRLPETPVIGPDGRNVIVNAESNRWFTDQARVEELWRIIDAAILQAVGFLGDQANNDQDIELDMN